MVTEPKLIAINPDSVKMGMIPFTLYATTTEAKLAILGEKGELITTARLQSLKQEGWRYFIPSEDRVDYAEYALDRAVDAQLYGQIPTRDIAFITHGIGRHLVAELFEHPGENKLQMLAHKYITLVCNLLQSDPEASDIFFDYSAEDSYLVSHAISTAVLALLVADHLEVRCAELRVLGLGTLLLDVGMMKIDRNITAKRTKLNSNDWRTVQQHPVLGRELLERSSLPATVLDIVKYHHERFDGSGYPDGQSGDKICFLTRIAAIADVYDALTTGRKYREANAHFKALQIIAEESEKYDPDVLRALLQIVLKDEKLVNRYLLL